MGCDGYRNEGFAGQEQSGGVFLPFWRSKEMFEQARLITGKGIWYNGWIFGERNCVE